MGHRLLEKYLQVVRMDGLQTNKNVTIGGSANFDMSGSTGTFKTPTGAFTLGSGTVTGSPTFSGTVTATGGLIQSSTNKSTVFHSGGIGFGATTAATQHQIVTTETYYAEVFIPANATITGVAVLNGATTNAGVNLNVGLANSAGTIVASSATTTAQGAANAWQQIPFSSPYSAVGPGKYFLAVQGSATTGYIATHTIGNFGASKVTSETYGTFLTTASYATTTFTTALGPVADTY